MEVYLAQPVTRCSVFAGRTVAAVLWLVVMTALIAIVQLASNVVFGLQIEGGPVLATVILCGMLALRHGALAFAIAGWIAVARNSW